MLALSIFLRVPITGQVKSRLATEIGAIAACELYRAFIADTLNKAQRLPNCQITLFVAGSLHAPELLALRRQWPFPCFAQCAGGLGLRMREALRWGRRQAPLAAVLGTDIPTLPMDHLQQARAALQCNATVFGPAADGGFYLVGNSGPSLPPLDHPSIRYSSPQALFDTRRACHDAGLGSALVRPWYDVDRPAELTMLADELSAHPARAPVTAACMQKWGFLKG